MDRESVLIGTVGKQIDAERFAAVGIWILIAYTLVRNLFAAASRPLWYDELCTLAVAHQATVSDVHNALQRTHDGNPPLFYFVEHIFGALIANAHIAYRLPSIIGFCCALWFIFTFIKRQSGGGIAFLCAALLLLTPLQRPFAVEARPYSLMIAAIAAALVCYQRAPKMMWVVLLGVSLAAAQSLHYYGCFAFIPFGLAELVLAVRSRNIRWRVWLALAAAVLPLVVEWSQLIRIKQFYGNHLWSPPSLFGLADAYSFVLKTYPTISVAIVCVISVAMLWRMATPKYSPGLSFESDGRTHELMLTLGLLAVPVVEYAVAKSTHGIFEGRHVLPVLLGTALGAGHLLRWSGRRGSIMLFAVFVLVAASLQEVSFWITQRLPLGIESPADSVEKLVSSAGHSDLPVLVSDGVDYVQFAYYASPEWRERFVGAVDPLKAIRYKGTDSLDLQLPLLTCCLPLQIYKFDLFAAQHPEFLVYSGGTDYDWWPQLLVSDGYLMQLIASENGRRVYLAHRAGS
jgi:4-amino-4-deoxy-L-arabinose transferase-like glycosyltransferase